MTIQQNNTLAKVALLFSGVAIFACFILLSSIFSYVIIFILLGVIFAIPNFLAINKYHLYRFALTANLAALMVLVVLASAHLWQNILNHTNIDLITALLMLVLMLVLALIWQLLSINFAQDSQKMSLNELIDHARKHPSILISLSIGLIVTDLVLIGLSLFPVDYQYISDKIINRGIIPPITLAIFFWGFLLIVTKSFMLLAEKQQTKPHYLQALYDKTNNNSHNNKDKDVALTLLWNQFESFYTLPYYINWAIPILGFIGTVLGISLATEQLGAALSDNVTESGQVLSLALTPLGIAFDTTLVALSLSIVLALLQTLLYRSEASYLRTLEEKFK